mmetsp:Transcript_18912/g.41277  ORF Transcript_18912/g.41277 Transcript_18912/m.41277 type:complete len:213 (+) Transcript_18912:1236-1874(+)
MRSPSPPPSSNGVRASTGPRIALEWSFSRSLYLNVFTLWSAELVPGEMQAIITVFEGQRDTKASRSTNVSLEARKGTCASLGSPIARMHSLSARSDLLIWAPSTLRCRIVDLESAARSDPAKSTSVTFPWMLPPEEAIRRNTEQTAWEREESLLMAVAWVVRRELPRSMYCNKASGLPAALSVRPAICTSFRASSSVSNLWRPLSRSYGLPP